MSTILLVDDDKALCRSLEIQLQLQQHVAKSAYTVEDGLSLASEFTPDLLLLDINMPDQDGISALPDFLKLRPETPIIIMTAEPGNQLVVDAMSAGAIDYIRKPFDLDQVLDVLQTFGDMNRSGHMQLDKDDDRIEANAPLEMIGSHPKMMDIHKMIGLLSRSRVTVLIQGESGTGKELAAQILHDASTPDKPFVAVNCSAVVPTLLESEFFGHEKGAFTGADKVKIGKLQYAGRGTVFLDEIGDMPLDLQGKLLRVLQEEEFTRVGGLEPIQLKARIVAATHHNLEQLVTDGKFRSDLFYRLTVSTIRLPSLRDRRNDIPQLTDFLLKKINKKLKRTVTSVAEDALQHLINHNWPGNVRELENVLTRAAALSNTTVLNKCDLDIRPILTGRHNKVNDQPLTLIDAEKQHIEKILTMNNWNITHTARMLDISRTTLRKKIHDYQLKELN